MAVIDVYYNKDTGNDSNSGLTPLLPKLTPTAFFAVGTANGYRFNLQTDMPLTVAITLPAFSITIQSDTDGVQRTISGSFSITGAGSGAVYKIKNILSKNFSGASGATSFFTIGTSSYWSFQSCEVDGTGFTQSCLPTGTSRQVVYKSCEFRNMWRACTSNNGSTFFNCIFKDFQNISASAVVLNNSTGQFTGCEFINCPTIISTGSSTLYISAIFNYCTFYSKDGRGVGTRGKLISYTNAANLDDTNMALNNCIFSNIDFIENLGAGTAAINGSLIFNNFIHSGTVNTTNYTSLGGDVVSATPQFYNEATFDFRLESTSPAAKENNGIEDNMGANELAHPNNFFSGVATNKVENGHSYRENQRAVFGNNKTGTAATGGESDINKVLSTSSIVAGTINPNTVLASNVNGTLPLSAVKATFGGTLSLDHILTVAGGLFVGVTDAAKYVLGTLFGIGGVGTSVGAEHNDVILASELESGKSKLNRNVIVNGTNKGEAFNTKPANNTVVAGTTWNYLGNLETGSRTSIYALLNPSIVESGFNLGNGTFGTLDINARANLPISGFVITGSGLFGKDLEFTPSYNPALSQNVRNDDPNQPGDLSPDNILTIADGNYEPALAENVREDDPNQPGTLSLNYILDTIGGLFKSILPFNVKKDVEFGVDQVGTNESSNPGEENVVFPVPYKIDSEDFIGQKIVASAQTYRASERLIGISEEIRLAGVATGKPSEYLVGISEDTRLIGEP